MSIPSPPETVKEPSSAKTREPVSLSEAKVIFDYLSFAVIFPANITFVIPLALTCNASDTTSIEELSTFTSKVFPAFTRARTCNYLTTPENCDTGNSVLLDNVLSVNVGVPLCVNT